MLNKLKILQIKLQKLIIFLIYSKIFKYLLKIIVSLFFIFIILAFILLCIDPIIEIEPILIKDIDSLISCQCHDYNLHEPRCLSSVDISPTCKCSLKERYKDNTLSFCYFCDIISIFDFPYIRLYALIRVIKKNKKKK